MPDRAYFGRSAAPAAGHIKRIEWMGTSLDDLRALPEEPRRRFGYGLHQAQLGRHPHGAKPLRGALGGLVELIEDFDGTTYRAIYTAKLRGVIYVLHVFQKKSKRGIATPRRELALIRERWRRAKAHYTAHYGRGGAGHGQD